MVQHPVQKLRVGVTAASDLWLFQGVSYVHLAMAGLADVAADTLWRSVRYFVWKEQRFVLFGTGMFG